MEPEEEVKDENDEDLEETAEAGAAPASASIRGEIEHSLEEDSFKTSTRLHVANSLQYRLTPIRRAGQGANLLNSTGKRESKWESLDSGTCMAGLLACADSRLTSINVFR